VVSGHAERWTGVRTLQVDRGTEVEHYEVEGARAYRDRLVLKLRGVDDAGGAAALKGCRVLAPSEEVPELPEGVYYSARLVGLRVRDEAGTDLGCVADVIETAGNDLLVVEQKDGHQWLVPMVKALVVEILDETGELVVRLPDGLLDLNR
jgi:16S rRNA processing protein RimM